MYYKKVLSLLAILLLTGGCMAHAEENETLLIEIYKNDGSIQCEKNSGTSALIMKRELEDKGIHVLDSVVSNDGMSYIAVCGASTGKINLYKIKITDLEKAQSMGFKVFDIKKLNK